VFKKLLKYFSTLLKNSAEDKNMPGHFSNFVTNKTKSI